MLQCDPTLDVDDAGGKTPSGLPFVGDLEWGSHFCHFYETAADLSDCLVPYFKAGLANHEKCLWVTAEPFDKAAASTALRFAVPNVEGLLAAGQIEILDHDEWYARCGEIDAEELPKAWLARVEAALAEGYRGLRVTGNTAFLAAPQWDDFMHYEETVHRCFQGQRIVALCSYPIPESRVEWTLDVIARHGFAIARRRGCWETIESAALAAAKSQLAELNRTLEARVAERTAALQQALADRIRDEQRLKLLVNEVDHRAKNMLAVIQAVVQLTRAETIEEFVGAVRGRIMALARAHALLADSRWRGADLRALVADELAPYRGEEAQDRVDIAGPRLALSPALSQTLALVLHELATNAAKYGALSLSGGSLSVAWNRDDAGILRLEWRETGGPPVIPPRRKGFGTGMIAGAIRNHLGGAASFDWRPQGLACKIVLPLDA